MINYNVDITRVQSSDMVVSVSEAKSHCNCDVETMDYLFLGWINAATEALERFTNLVFMPSIIHYKGVQNNDDVEKTVRLPYVNNAVLTGGSATKYTLIGDRIYTSDNEIDITYTAGTATKDWMKQAVLMYVADLYVNRGEISGNVGESSKQYCKNFINHGAFF